MQLLLAHARSSSVKTMDPRLKMIWLLGNASIGAAFPRLLPLSLILFMILITCAASRIKIKAFLPLLKIMTVIGVQFILLQGLLRSRGAVILEVGKFKLYAGGMLTGLEGMLLLLILTLLFLQFLMWTSPDELSLLMIKCKLPHKYAVLFGLAVRFLPLIEKDLRSIRESQEARGREFRTIRQMTGALPSIILPLILRTLKRSQEVALSMELKGYTLHATRAWPRSLVFSGKDYQWLAVCMVYFPAMILLGRLV